MSTSLSRRSSSTAHPTRQQLDDLDALLKRMLELPVQRGEDEADATPPAGQSAPETLRGPHRPMFPAESGVNYTTKDEEEADLKPRVVTDAPAGAKERQPDPSSPDGAAPEEWVPLNAAWRPSARTWKPLSDAWREAQAATNPTPAVEEEPSLAVDGTSPDEPAAAPAPDAESVPPPELAMSTPTLELSSSVRLIRQLTFEPGWASWLLAGFNAAFDACLTPWGAPGRWLRGPAGRMLIGVAGLLCLAAAAALTLTDWFGWTR